MRTRKGKPWRWLLLACAPLLLMLNACGSSSTDAAATLSAQAIFTAAYQTFSAQAAQFALTPVARTPLPTPSISLPPSSPSAQTALASPAVTSSGQTACDSSVYVSDATIPDGTVIAAGSKFIKTWVLQNNGTCAWSTSYQLAFDSGDQMGGSDVALQSPVPAGQQASISVNLVAPMSAGAYKGTWRMHNGNGQPFGDYPYVQINVGAVAAATACHKESRNEVTISGHAGPEAVTINYGDGTVATDPNGTYSFTVPAGWSGTVIPSKAKVHPWTFSPDHRTYSNVNCDLIHENYVATAPPGT